MSHPITRRDFVAAMAAVPLALASRADAGAPRRAARAFVTADLESRIAIVDLRSGSVAGSIATAAGPRSIERVGAVLVVAHTEGGLLSIVDPGRARVTATLDGLGEPRYTAAHPNGRVAYVSDSRRGIVLIVSLDERKVVGRVDVGGPARHITIDPGGQRLWVALGNAAAELAIVDLASPRRVARVRRVPAIGRAHDVVITPDASQVWVTSGTERRIDVRDAEGGRRLFSVPAGAPPQHVAMLGRRVVVASGDDGTLTVHDRRGRPLRVLRTPVGSYNVDAAGGLFVTPSLSVGTLSIARAGAGAARALPVARAAHDACLVLP